MRKGFNLFSSISVYGELSMSASTSDSLQASLRDASLRQLYNSDALHPTFVSNARKAKNCGVSAEETALAMITGIVITGDGQKMMYERYAGWNDTVNKTKCDNKLTALRDLLKIINSSANLDSLIGSYREQKKQYEKDKKGGSFKPDFSSVTMSGISGFDFIDPYESRLNIYLKEANKT